MEPVQPPAAQPAPDVAALVDRALELHPLGYNCAQCVACALAPQVGVSADLCFRATEGFGAGMGTTTETCGAVSGGVLVLGLASSAGIDAPTRKAATYALTRELVGRFRDEVGATVCREIKGAGAAQPLRSCNDCIAVATRLTAEILEQVAK